MIESLDHIVYSAADLPGAVAAIQDLLGATATPGGSHEGLGSQNYLVSLGPSQYLEIVGPDPAQGVPEGRLWLAGVTRPLPAVTTWACRHGDLEALRADCPDLVGEIVKQSRVRPDGTVLSWTLTLPDRTLPFEGIVPFFIDWGETRHPASTLEDQGLRLVSLTPVHPNPEGAEEALVQVGVPGSVREGDPRLLVRIARADGVEVELG